ncbi:Phytochrome-like protein cph2 [compost metagenome]
MTMILDAVPSWREVSVIIVGLAMLVVVVGMVYAAILRLRKANHRSIQEGQDQSGLFIWTIHNDKQVIHANEFAHKLLGFHAQSLIGLKYDEISELNERYPQFTQLLDQLLSSKKEGHSSIMLKNSDTRCETKLVFRVIITQDSKTGSKLYTLYGLDITEADLGYEEISASVQVHGNPVSRAATPNRPFLLWKINEFITKDVTQAALFFIDSDNFKYLNDTLGHSCGDQLMQRIMTRLSQHIEQKGTLLHLGGDKFIVLISGFHKRVEVVDLIEGIMGCFKQPFIVMDNEIYVTLSIGVSFYPEDGGNQEELFKNAELAMYSAKEQGKDRFVIYEPSLLKAFNERYNIEKHLRKGIKNKEFVLHYQPQVCLKRGEVIGAEALIRWQSPELGMVSPLTFIKIAEDSRLIIEIGEWVLREACIFGKRMNDLHQRPFKISVNISLLQVLHEGFIDMVDSILKESGLSPSQLELEITESVFVESFELILWKLELIKSTGVQFALDDFGTGYSSLSYLERMPITTLKIDKAFIQQVSSHGVQHSLARSITLIGRKLGLTVVAEGVENKEQLEYVKRAKCDVIQGYYISKPLTETQLINLLDREIVYDV